MSKDAAEDRRKYRYEKLECPMEEMLAKKDEKIAKLEEKVTELEELLIDAISQINALALERNSAKEAAAAANARSTEAKAGKKKDDKKRRKSKSTHKRAGRERPADTDREATADVSVCDACGSDHFSEVPDEYTSAITEVEQVKAEITRISVKRRRCADCKKLVPGRTDMALPNSRFGINFMVTVAALKLHGMSNQRIREIVAVIYPISMTESAINRMILRMAREIGALYGQSEKRYASPRYATGMRVPGALTAQTTGCG